MKTRIIALLLAMVVVLTCLASCVGNKTPGTGGGGKEEGGDDTTSSYPWNKTTLYFRMTENSNQEELSSTCRRYLAGDTTQLVGESAGTIDEWVANRNDEALKETNVNVEYLYYPESKDNYTWGECIDDIYSEVVSGKTNRPDIFCNFVFDMVACSLKNCFANLLSTEMYEDDHELAGADHNYFDFTDPTYVDTGVGYMNEYMRSLTLSKYKMYCLSSDYFTDMVRAFLVVPVSIGLLEQLQTEGTYDKEAGKGDVLADRVTTRDPETKEIETNYTIEDFYQLVNDMEWTYEALAKFSQKITSDEGTGDEGTDLRDIIGFALGTSSGLPASGMLYTTSITIIDRTYNADKGDYIYSYPGMKQDASGTFVRDETVKHDELITFCDNLNTLFQTNGIISVKTGVDTYEFGDTDLQAIRNRFAEDKVLFGGVICLGSLEYEEYQEMRGQGRKGFGIVPVPLYRSGSNDKYLTQIHNIGRVGAISYTTDEFSQCTAYLNYQSNHSTDILNEYYNFKLSQAVNNEGTQNVEMLNYIRYNVRSSFDKAFEDALGIYYSQQTGGDSEKQKWHQLIKDANYQLTNMEQLYDSYGPVKAGNLYNLEVNIYPTLPK